AAFRAWERSPEYCEIAVDRHAATSGSVMLVRGVASASACGQNVQVIRAHDFTGRSAWDALSIERIDDATVRLHWTDQPYRWHINDGPEVFAVLDGRVDMHVRTVGGEQVLHLETGDIVHGEPGDEHVAHPLGEARILVIERAGSR